MTVVKLIHSLIFNVTFVCNLQKWIPFRPNFLHKVSHFTLKGLVQDLRATYSLCLYFQKKQGTNIPRRATVSQNMVIMGSTATLEKLGLLTSLPSFKVVSMDPITLFTDNEGGEINHMIKGRNRLNGRGCTTYSHAPSKMATFNRDSTPVRPRVFQQLDQSLNVQRCLKTLVFLFYSSLRITFPSFLSLLLIVYLPIGLVLFIIRVTMLLQALIILSVIPNGSVQRYIVAL